MADRNERGFASMDAEQHREIASKGGRTAHERGTAHEFDHEEAVQAGRRGGVAVSRDRQHMAEIGRKGGQAARIGRSADQAGGRRGPQPAAQQV
jgi:general stress protein YciG